MSVLNALKVRVENRFAAEKGLLLSQILHSDWIPNIESCFRSSPNLLRSRSWTMTNKQKGVVHMKCLRRHSLCEQMPPEHGARD